MKLIKSTLLASALFGIMVPTINISNNASKESFSQKRESRKIEDEKKKIASEHNVEYLGDNFYIDKEGAVYEARYNEKIDFDLGSYKQGTFEKEFHYRDNATAEKIILKRNHSGDSSKQTMTKARFKKDGFFGGNHYEYSELKYGENTGDDEYDIMSYNGDGSTSDNSNGHDWIWDFTKNNGRHDGAFIGSAEVRVTIGFRPDNISIKMYGSQSSGWADGWMDIEGQVKSTTLYYDGVFLIDNYNFSDDDYNIGQTQKRIYSHGCNYDGKGKVITDEPYFTNRNTYQDFEDFILSDEIVVPNNPSDKIPFKYTTLNFYDENNNLIIDKHKHLTSDEITFSLTGDGSPNVIGESDKMTYKIPYIENGLVAGYHDNAFTQSHSKHVWLFIEDENYEKIGGFWTLKTNQGTDFKLYPNDINKIESTSNNETTEIVLDEVYSYETKQVDPKTNAGLKYSFGNKLFKTNGDTYYFEYDYTPLIEGFINQYDSNGDVITLEFEGEDVGYVNNPETGNLYMNEKSFFDLNNNDVTESGEIFNVNVVNGSFKAESIDDSEIDYYKYSSEQKEYWTPIKTNENGFLEDEGIYKVVYEDEYKINKYEEIVEINLDGSSNNFEKWAYGNDLYNALLYETPIETNLDNLVYQEINRLALLHENSTVDLGTIEFSKEGLNASISDAPPGRLTLEQFSISLENEIDAQINSVLNDVAIKGVDYDIEWITELDTIVDVGTELTFHVYSIDDSEILRGEQTFSFNAFE